jgi:single-stranded-DNA-specific exonuclease
LKNQAWKQWKVHHDTKERFPCEELGISPLTAQVLRNRGIDSAEQARRFLFPTLFDLPDPSSMKDMAKAVERVAKAIRNREPIMLYGDYDVDGTTATALLLLFLKKIGGRVDFYIPDRLQEGYGLNLEAVQRIQAQGASLLITVDCGITNLEEVRYAQEKGLDVIITDHHEVPSVLPPALAVVNPKQKDCPYPFKGLAGVGVAFNLVIALRSFLRKQNLWEEAEIPNLKEYLDLVGLGTISDVVPLLGANRVLAKYGLAQINQSTRPGILALREISGIKELPVDTAGIHFRFAPRMNAAGRIGDARETVRLLVSEDKTEAQKIAVHLNELNSKRQQIEEKILTEAREMIEASSMGKKKKSLVLASPNWHPGVIGIVASRLTEEYHRPAVLIALKEKRGKGSARSIDCFPLYQALKACESWLERLGGHEQAAGLAICEDCLTGFSEAFEEIVKTMLKEEDLLPWVAIDAFTRLDQMSDAFLNDLESLAPFGPDNPEPVLGIEGLTVLNSRLVGKGHMRLLVKEGRITREAIGFRMAAWHPLSQERMKMAFVPQRNIFQGKRNLQLKIVDLQPQE